MNIHEATQLYEKPSGFLAAIRRIPIAYRFNSKCRTVGPDKHAARPKLTLPSRAQSGGPRKPGPPVSKS